MRKFAYKNAKYSPELLRKVQTNFKIYMVLYFVVSL